MALRRARDARRPLYGEVFTLVVEKVNALRPKIDAVLLVPRESVVVVAVPKSPNDINKLLRPVITIRMGDVRLTAIVQGVIFIAAGDDVPTCPSSRNMIK